MNGPLDINVVVEHSRLFIFENVVLHYVNVVQKTRL